MNTDGKYILAVNPWIYDFTAYDLWLKPMGLLGISGYLRRVGYDVRLFDCLDRCHPSLIERGVKSPRPRSDGRGGYISENVETPDILKGIPRRFKRYGIPLSIVEELLASLERPRLILLTSLMTYWYPGVVEMSGLLKKIFPGVSIALGGLYAEILADHARQNVNPEFINSSEGLTDLRRFVDDLFSQPRSLNISSNGLPSWFVQDYSFFSKPGFIPLLTSVGCPYRCDFCLTPSRWNRYQSSEPGIVIETITRAVSRFEVRDFVFYDDALLFNKRRHLFKIMKGIIDRRLDVRFHTPNGIFPREIDRETAELMYASGFKTLRLSFESSDPRRQREMGKVENSHLSSAADCLEAAGFHRKDIEVYLMIGLPNQKPEEVEDGMNFIGNLGMRPHLAYFSPIPGTPTGDAVIRAYFKKKYDPLLTNKFAFLLWHPYIGVSEFAQLRNVKKRIDKQVSDMDDNWPGFLAF